MYEYYEYKGEPLTCIRELDHRREWISDIKCSPCTPRPEWRAVSGGIAR